MINWAQLLKKDIQCKRTFTKLNTKVIGSIKFKIYITWTDRILDCSSVSYVWLAHVLPTTDMTGLNNSVETGCPDLDFPWFSWMIQQWSARN